jgi:hypothetical protein
VKKAQIALSAGAAAMVAGIAYALIVGNLSTEAGVLLELPWFHLSMLDLYVGFFLFGGWIAYRERSVGRTIVWLALLLSLGNVTACVYALVVAMKARGDWTKFWMGDRSPA